MCFFFWRGAFEIRNEGRDVWEKEVWGGGDVAGKDMQPDMLALRTEIRHRDCMNGYWKGKK